MGFLCLTAVCLFVFGTVALKWVNQFGCGPLYLKAPIVDILAYTDLNFKVSISKTVYITLLEVFLFNLKIRSLMQITNRLIWLFWIFSSSVLKLVSSSDFWVLILNYTFVTKSLLSLFRSVPKFSSRRLQNKKAI